MVYFWSKLGCENDGKRCVLLCFRDLGDSKIDPKIVAEFVSKKFDSLRLAECAPAPEVIISKDFLRKKTEKKANRRVRTRWSAKSGVQKANTEIQKGKCKQGTHNARKYARCLRPRADLSAPCGASTAAPSLCGSALWCVRLLQLLAFCKTVNGCYSI